jgi:hypothetical protein
MENDIGAKAFLLQSNVKVKVDLEQATKGQRGSSGIALFFL